MPSAARRGAADDGARKQHGVLLRSQRLPPTAEEAIAAEVARLEARRAEKLREAERQQQREDDAREDARRSKQLQERLAELRREKALLAEENARLSAEVAAVMDAPDADDKEREALLVRASRSKPQFHSTHMNFLNFSV